MSRQNISNKEGQSFFDEVKGSVASLYSDFKAGKRGYVAIPDKKSTCTQSKKQNSSHPNKDIHGSYQNSWR